MGRPLPAVRRQPDDLDEGADHDQRDGGDEQDGRDDVGAGEAVADDRRGRGHDGEDRGDAACHQPGRERVVGDVATLAPADGQEDDPDDGDDVDGHTGQALRQPHGIAGRAAGDLQRVRPERRRPGSGDRVEDEDADGQPGDDHHGPQPADPPAMPPGAAPGGRGWPGRCRRAATSTRRPSASASQRGGGPLGGGVGVVLHGERRGTAPWPRPRGTARRAGGGPGAPRARPRRAGRPSRG